MVTKDLEQAIVEDYLSKQIFIKDICKKYNISNYIFNSILKKNNIEKYDPHFLYPQNQKKYPLNESFFDTENPEMAYVLGFLAADGTVRKNTNDVKLTLAEQDKEILEKFYKHIGGRPIKIYEDSKGYKNATWVFTSKHIKNKLAEYNVVPQKTFNFSFPKKLNKKYWIDFIRGYFDGDGSISTAGPHAIRWQLCAATKEPLETIVSFLEQEYSIPKVNIQIEQRVHPLYVIQYSSVPTRKIYDILYYQGCWKLDRKYKKFTEIFSINLKK